MLESDIKRLAREELKLVLRQSYPDHIPFVWQNIESRQTGDGLPDIYVVALRTPVMIEAKRWQYKASPFQINWHLQHEKAGGSSWLLTWNSDTSDPQARKKGRPAYAKIGPRMLDYSSIGAWIRATSPELLTTEQWLIALRDRSTR